MAEKLNLTITRLVIQAMDRAKVTADEWRALRVGTARLQQLRNGAATFSDAELDRISRVTGESWEHLVLAQLGDGSTSTKAMQALIGSLQLLGKAAKAEASTGAGAASRSSAFKRFRRGASSKRLSA